MIVAAGRSGSEICRFEANANADRVLSRMDALDEVSRILERYLSSLNAQALLQRALREQKLEPSKLKSSDLSKLMNSLQRGIRLFVGDADCERALEEIATLCDKRPQRATPCTVTIGSELDISTARNEARRICEHIGAKNFAIQKVTTIVSELARNIVSYTKGGTLDIVPVNGERRKVVVRAIDMGPGIQNLAHILSGAYKSKTGLGKGLLGTKRLADYFDIATSAGGTLIVAEVHL